MFPCVSEERCLLTSSTEGTKYVVPETPAGVYRGRQRSTNWNQLDPPPLPFFLTRTSCGRSEREGSGGWSAGGGLYFSPYGAPPDPPILYLDKQKCPPALTKNHSVLFRWGEGGRRPKNASHDCKKTALRLLAVLSPNCVLCLLWKNLEGRKR